jgi:HSP20 family molecular chaperone IbpA
VFGAVSFLIDLAVAVSAAADPSDDVRERPDVDSGDFDECDDAMGCRPLVDVVEEEDELVVLMEIPGFYSEPVHFSVLEDVLVLADSQGNEYHEVLLPMGYAFNEATSASFNNGVTIIKFPRAAAPCLHRKIA